LSRVTTADVQPDASSTTERPGGDAIIRLDNVHKRFGQLRVLRGVTLDIQRGETTVVLGPSGTGKSVLLKHIVGLIKPDQGAVYFEDQRVDQLRERDAVDLRKRIGFLFQMGALFDSMNVRDNICFPLKQHTDQSEEQQTARCERVLEMVGLSGIEGKMPADLSGGQKKRVALARAIVMEPDVVLYDEPTTGLDPIRGDLINELIIMLGRRLGITSIAVTHDMVSARKIADRMVMLYGGEILADGGPETFEDVPDERVSRFVHGQADQDDLDLIQKGFEDRGTESNP